MSPMLTTEALSVSLAKAKGLTDVDNRAVIAGGGAHKGAEW